MTDFWASYDSKRRSIIPSWQSLRRIQQSRTTKVFAYAPIIALTIIGIDEFYKISDVSSVPTRIRLLLFGGVLIIISNMIFDMLCPALIKKYASDVDFVKSEFELLSVDETGVFANRMSILDGNKEFKDFALRESEMTEDITDKMDIMMKYYNIKNRFKQRLSRFFLMATYTTGIALVLIPTAQTVIRALIAPAAA